MRTLIRGLASVHAPLGRWAPAAASALFASAGLAQPGLLRILIYCGAMAFAILIAADIADSFIDRHSYPKHRAVLLTLPMLIFRVMLTTALGSFYAFLVFLGVGPLTPFILLPVLFGICWFIAWRNVDLWYEEGAEFEEELRDEAYREHTHLADAGGSKNR